jgi:hypothetical protein
MCGLDYQNVRADYQNVRADYQNVRADYQNVRTDYQNVLLSTFKQRTYVVFQICNSIKNSKLIVVQ